MNKETKQTAVEWLVNQMIENYHLTDESYYDFNQAKEMEKEQIIEAFEIGVQSEFFLQTFNAPSNDGEKYYNETYGGGEK